MSKKPKYTKILYQEDAEVAKYMRNKVKRMGMSEWLRNLTYKAMLIERNK